MASFSPLFFISFLLVGISAIVNSFLIYFATKIRPRTNDIIIVIALATIELVFPVVKITNTVYQITTGVNIIHSELGCQVNGSFLNLLYFLEIMFSYFLASERLSKITGKPLSRLFMIPFFSVIAGFFILIIWVAIRGDMSAYPADLTCFADPFKSTVATITFFYFIAACYYATISIVYCYYKLSREVLKAYDFVDLELRATNGTVNDTKSRSWNYKLASFKIYLTMAIYCSLMLISVTFLVTIQYGPKVTVSQIGFSKLADILTILFFLIGLTSNSVLLMMLHTGVNREMNAFISKFKRK